MEKQKVFRITEDRKLLKQKLNVEGESVIDRVSMKGWLRFREYIGKVKGMKQIGGLPDNSRVMVIDDRDGVALSPYRPTKENLKKLCEAEGDNQMADRAGDYHLTEIRNEERKAWYYNSMALAIMGIVFCFVIVLILYVSGRINLGAK